MGERQARPVSADRQNVLTNCICACTGGYRTREPRLDMGGPDPKPMPIRVLILLISCDHCGSRKGRATSAGFSDHEIVALDSTSVLNLKLKLVI
jgi:hypothetical protein